MEGKLDISKRMFNFFQEKSIAMNRGHKYEHFLGSLPDHQFMNYGDCA